jgi:hypothetical protein
MNDVKEQRIYIKFCFKLGKMAAETHKMLKETLGDNALGMNLTYAWFKRFQKGRMSVDDDDERSGRPSTGNTTENVAEYVSLPTYHAKGNGNSWNLAANISVFRCSRKSWHPFRSHCHRELPI